MKLSVRVLASVLLAFAVLPMHGAGEDPVAAAIRKECEQIDALLPQLQHLRLNQETPFNEKSWNEENAWLDAEGKVFKVISTGGVGSIDTHTEYYLHEGVLIFVFKARGNSAAATAPVKVEEERWFFADGKLTQKQVRSAIFKPGAKRDFSKVPSDPKPIDAGTDVAKEYQDLLAEAQEIAQRLREATGGSVPAAPADEKPDAPK